MTRTVLGVAMREIRAGRLVGWLALGTACAVSFAIAQVTMPLVIAAILDTALTADGSAQALRWHTAALAVLSLLVVVFRAGQRLAHVHLAERVMQNLRGRMLRHLERLPISYFDAHHSATVKSLHTEDIPAVATLYNPVLADLLLSLAQVAVILAVVSYKYGALVLLAFALLPAYALLPMTSSRLLRSASRAIASAKDGFAARLQELIEGIRVTRAFTSEGWAETRMSDGLAQVSRAQRRRAWLMAVSDLSSAIYWVSASVIYWIGGRQVLAGDLRIGELVALVWYMSLLDSPAVRLVGLNAQLQTALASWERVRAFFESPTESRTVTLPTAAAVAPVLEFRRVSFTYPGQSRPAVRDLSFRANRGMRIAVVGPSGAGKSTFGSLLLGFYPPDSGEIALSGTPVRAWPRSELNRRVCPVFQETFLFQGTIRDNIALGRPDASADDVEHAAILANADAFIRALPDAYDTEVGERGIRLSVGQRQRLAIARALLRDPDVLLLDEPTSALDAASEHAVRTALDRAAEGRTTITIAHTLRTAAEADLVLVLDSGGIVGVGRHESLLDTCPLYAGLTELQALGPAVRPHSLFQEHP
jgi:ABC-type multidrug transport system fused ATPase/permease subunit